MAAQLPRLTAFVESWRPDVIVRESWEFGLTLVAEMHGIPMARVGLGLAATEDQSVGLAAPRIDEARRSAGLPADPDGARLRDAPYLTMVPESLDEPGSSPPEAMHRFRFAAPEATAPLADGWPGNEDRSSF